MRMRVRSRSRRLSCTGFEPFGVDSPVNKNVEAFLEMEAAERGASPRTIDAYGRDLANFAEYLGSAERIALASSADLRGYLDHLHAQGMAARTAARRLSCLRQFFKFLYAEGQRADDPTAVLDSPRLGRTLPKFLTETEVETLLAAARTQTGPE